MTPPNNDDAGGGPDAVCRTKGREIEEAWARHRAGDGKAFLLLVAEIYDWLDRRVVSILRSYPGVRLPPDEVLAGHVLDRVGRMLLRKPPGSCEDFTRLVSSRIRYALRDVLRGQKREKERTVPMDGPALEDDAVWLEDAKAVNPLEELAAREEGVQFAEARARFDEAAAALPEPLRQAFCLRYYAGLSYRDVAAELGVKADAARKRVDRAVDEISLRLTGKPFEGERLIFHGVEEADEGRICFCRRTGKATSDRGEAEPPGRQAAPGVDGNP